MTSKVGISVVLLSLVFGSNAMAATIASFTDPGTQSFSFVDIGTNGDGVGQLTAANSDIEVLLPMLGVTFTDASYTLTDQSGGALDTTSQVNTAFGVVQSVFEGGVLSIVTDIAENSLNAGDVILQATFDTAVSIFGNLLTADDFIGNDVEFTGFAVDSFPGVTGEQFSFSTANVNPGSALLNPADMEDFTATTSFTSSATPVPLPAAFWLFGAGIATLLGASRKV